MKKEKEKKPNKKLKKVFISIFILIVVCATLIGLLIFNIYDKYKEDISDYIESGYEKVNQIDEDTFNSIYPTQILDSEGNVLKEFKIINYEYTEYEDINPDVFKALIAIEDERFYEHKGIDIYGLIRAFYYTVFKDDVQGGSTITQQLAKNIFLTMEQTLWRKLEEAVIAQELEKLYSKEEILEFYLNNINYANGCYSIESASKFYFDKKTSELNLAEIALLISIPNNPSIYNPITNMENTLNRKNLVLQSMLHQEMITETEYNEEKSREIVLNVKDTIIDNSLGENYALNYTVQKATEELMKLNGFEFRYLFETDEQRELYFNLYNEAYKENRQELIEGGYKIQTSIDMNTQNKLQEIVDNEFKAYTQINEENDLYMKQASATVIDNTTGNVVAIVGGRSQDGNTYNRAVLGARQPGSAIKPLVSYIPAFEKGYLPEDKIEDEALDVGIKNWYSGYKGYVTLRYATEISINTTAYKLTEEIGSDNAINYLANMNFKYLTPNDSKYPIISLGGFERGATTLEMASAYSALARNGEFIEPSNIESITKIGLNEVIYENLNKKERVFDEGASYLMTDTLKGVLSESYGTGYRNRLSNYTYQAGKTGTTSDAKDYWFCGYTPHYSMSVWGGDDTPSAQNSSVNHSVGNVWNKMMTYLHTDKENIDFEKPEVVIENKDELSLLLSDLKQREVDESNRKQDEIKTQQERLGDESYRIIYGLSEEEELERERIAENKLYILKTFNFTSLEEIEYVNEILDDTYRAIENVKRKSAYDIYSEQYYEHKNKLENIRMELREEERLEEEKLLQEQLEQEREEALLQEELEQSLEEENENIEENE